MSFDPTGASTDLGRTEPAAWLSARLEMIRRTLDRPLLSAVLVVLALSVAVKALAVAKDLLVAYRFGISDELDAFIVASLVPTTIVYGFGASASDAFLPLFVRERSLGHSAAAGLFGATTMLGIGALTGVALAVALGAPQLVALLGPGFGHATSALATSLLLLMLPVLVLGGWSSTWPALLNASGRHAITAAVALITPAVTIALMLIAVDRWGVLALVAGVVVGASAETVVLAISVSRTGFSVVPRRHWSTIRMRDFMGQLVPLIAAAAVGMGSLIVDQAMATSTGQGAVSALTYANKIVLLLSGLAGLVLTLVVLPRFASLVDRRDGRTLRRTLTVSIGIALLGGLLVTAAVVVWSSDVVALLFERGSFTASDTALVATVQALLALQMPFLLASLVAIRALVALSRARVILVATVLNLALHYVGNVMLIPVLGVHGIALSTSLASVMVCAVLLLTTSHALSSARASGETAPA